MVVRTDRNRVIHAIAAYLRGEIDNFTLDDATMGYRGSDETIRWVGLTIWRTYDDIRRHRVRLNRQGWQLCRRCIAFLQTDLELTKPLGKLDWSVWPFQNRHDVFAARPKLNGFSLPVFDAGIHSKPIPSAKISIWWLPFIVTVELLVFWLFT